MKVHTGRMLDRRLHPHPCLVVQEDNGRIVEVRVRDEDRAAASQYWGGNYVAYVYRGGRAVYLALAEGKE